MTEPRADLPARHETEHDQAGHRGHSRWMMLACCVPMLLIAVAIAASGAGIAFLAIAVMCTVLMAAMMGGTGEGEDQERR